MARHFATAPVLFITKMENEYCKALLENPETINADVNCLGMSVKMLNPAHLV